jgi:hypothetical protein
LAPLEEILPGLHRWTADVPDWTPDQGGPEGWAQEVACVAWEGEDALVLVDPLVGEADWGEIDALVERHDGPVVVVTTCPWHARSAAEAIARYVNSPGASSYAHTVAAEDSERVDFAVDHPLSGSAELPGGVWALTSDAPQGEITLYIEPIRAVIAGDVLIGAEGERSTVLRVCPKPWFAGLNTVDSAKSALRPLLEREIEAIVPLHGAPVLDRAYETLQEALA